MRNIGKIVVSLLLIFLITGCASEGREKKLVCTSRENEDGMNTEQVISMTYKNDKLKFMTMEFNTKVTDAEVQKNWELFKKSMDEENKEFDKDGVSLKVQIDDQNYEYKIILDVDVENASKEMLDSQGLGDLKDNSGTLESNKEQALKDGAVCEIK